MVPLEINLGPLLPHHLSELIMGILLALVLYLVIRKFVSPRFEAMYAERRASIEGGMERAERAQAEAQAALEEYTRQLTELRTEAGQIREEARAQGAQIVADLREQANAESARILAAARSQIEAERIQAVEQLRNEVGGLATTLAGRIIGESLDDDERARRTVDRFLADLESQQPSTSSVGSS